MDEEDSDLISDEEEEEEGDGYDEEDIAKHKACQSGVCSICTGPIRRSEGKHRGEPVVYKRRWYVLAVFCVLVAVDGVAVTGLNPVAHATQIALGWTNAGIDLLNLWTPLAYILTSSLSFWLLDKKGLRLSCLLCAFLMALGCGIRSIPASPYITTYLIHGGHVVYNLASTIAKAAPSYLVVAWFPIPERPKAIAICLFSNSIATALTSIIGPVLVPIRTASSQDTNVTLAAIAPLLNHTIEIHTVYNSTDTECSLQSDYSHIQHMQMDIRRLLYVQFLLALSALFLILLYFPPRPPSSPSALRLVEIPDFKSGMVAMSKNSTFWILALVFTATIGIYTHFAAILNITLKDAGVANDQLVAGCLNFLSIMGSMSAALLCASFLDQHYDVMKKLLFTALVGYLAMFLWFSLMISHFAALTIYGIGVSFVLGSVILMTTTPLFYELASECVLPVPPGTAARVFTLINSVTGMVLFLVLLSPSIGTAWLSWTMVIAVALASPALLLYNDRLARLILDGRDKAVYL